ncbi:MAG: cobyrinate a,c-diamide synthase [Prevotella sp.]|nr:cobyrinate a,c-diamide synthase [Prevotella sp.]
MKSAFLIAAPASGSGKTTVARGLMKLFTTKGLTVQPFKCGPDYIDTKFHAAVCGRPSVNLDTFMASPEHVSQLFTRYGTEADVGIVEGMMGLFDGYDRDRGSAYEIARELGLPVVLVVDAKSTAYSMAALLSGFVNFRSDISFAGVIYNKVGSEKHGRMLRQVSDDVSLPCLGLLPKATSLEQASRYLGLDFSQTAESRELVTLLEKHVDWQRLLQCQPFQIPEGWEVESGRWSEEGERWYEEGRERKAVDCHNVLIARNAESFSFIYQETIDAMGNVSFFDPETEVPTFEGIDLLYLPGGYPEKHLEALTGNEACRRAIRDFAERGGRIIAECGGMMYLCRSIVSDDGEYPMCGVLPHTITARQADRRLSLGYRRFVLDGQEYRGHEFHYTQFVSPLPPSATQVCDALGQPTATPVVRYKNVIASYTHLYLNETNLY